MHRKERASECQSAVTGQVQLTGAGRVIKPGTYFDAGPELAIEEHGRIGAPILQDTADTQTYRQTYRQTHRRTHQHTETD